MISTLTATWITKCWAKLADFDFLLQGVPWFSQLLFFEKKQKSGPFWLWGPLSGHCDMAGVLHYEKKLQSRARERKSSSKRRDSDLKRRASEREGRKEGRLFSRPTSIRKLPVCTYQQGRDPIMRTISAVSTIKRQVLHRIPSLRIFEGSLVIL